MAEAVAKEYGFNCDEAGRAIKSSVQRLLSGECKFKCQHAHCDTRELIVEAMIHRGGFSKTEAERIFDQAVDQKIIGRIADIIVSDLLIAIP